MAPKTARARRLGIALRAHREAAGLTLEAAADEINSTRSTLSRYENAQTLVNPATVRALLSLYGVRPEEIAAAVQLAKDTRKPGWWVPYSHLLDKRTIDFIALEAEATAIANFEPSIVPGLLQTADYIRGVMRGGPHTLTDDQVEQRVKLRLDRQQRITAAEPPIFDAIIDEGALLRPVGDRTVMEAQLQPPAQDGGAAEHHHSGDPALRRLPPGHPGLAAHPGVRRPRGPADRLGGDGRRSDGPGPTA